MIARVPVLAVLFLVGSFLTPGDQQVFAQSPSAVYSVADIAVDEFSSTTTIAREEALRGAVRDGWQRLSVRLVVGDAGSVATLDAETLESLVQGIEIIDEQLSPGRYVGMITVHYTRSPVLDVLRQSGVEFLSEPGPVLVVLPLFESTGMPVLWRAGNAWLSAWQKSTDAGDSIEFVVPVGGLGDIGTIGVDDVLAEDRTRLADFRKRYNADGVLVARARYANGMLQVTLEWHDSIGSRSVPGYSAILNQDTANGKPPDLVESVMAVRKSLSDHWADLHLAPPGAPQEVIVDLKISRLDDWVDARRRLRALAAIQRVIPRIITRDRVQMQIHYTGTLENLGTHLRRVGLELSDAQGAWIISIH